MNIREYIEAGQPDMMDFLSRESEEFEEIFGQLDENGKPLTKKEIFTSILRAFGTVSDIRKAILEDVLGDIEKCDKDFLKRKVPPHLAR